MSCARAFCSAKVRVTAPLLRVLDAQVRHRIARNAMCILRRRAVAILRERSRAARTHRSQPHKRALLRSVCVAVHRCWSQLHLFSQRARSPIGSARLRTLAAASRELPRKKRHQGESNPFEQSPIDFESIS